MPTTPLELPRRWISALILVAALACGKSKGEALTVTDDQVTLAEGTTVRVCTRSIRQPFEVGGAFECPGELVVKIAANGKPDVSESELWAALVEAGVNPAKVGEGYLYGLQVGEDPRTAQPSSMSFDAQADASASSLIGEYVFAMSDGSLRIYVGLVGSS